MDINQEWNKAATDMDKDLSALLDMAFIAKLPTIDPLEKIRRAILINACWGLVISVGYIFVLANLPGWQVELCIGLILLLTLYAMTRTLILYRKLRLPAGDGTILRELERRYDQVRQWMKLQQWVALLLYPVSVAGGFMLGGSLGSGKPVGMLMQKPGWIALLVITAAILVPLCYYAGRWMSQKAFGQYADQLKEKIDSLKGEG